MIGLALTQLKVGGNPNMLPWPWESKNFLLIYKEKKRKICNFLAFRLVYKLFYTKVLHKASGRRVKRLK